MVFWWLVALASVLFSFVQAIDNGLGKTPQMGWNSWNFYFCNINQTVIKETADKICSLGLDKLGYKYLNLDDCWQSARDNNTGVIIIDQKKFPSGMEVLSQYVHNKGLKFGIYSDAGTKTCQGKPGSYNYEKIDAETYAKWKIDYLKYDNCFSPNVSAIERYSTMSKALNETGKPIFFSICNWGQQKVWQWGTKIGNSWRTTLDITNDWPSFVRNLEQQVGLQKYAGPGGWNDPDMLEVGNGGLTHNQELSHFSLWCLLKAPLLIGTNLHTIPKQSLQILMNKELIDINQDELGIQGKRIKSEVTEIENKQVWGGPLSNDRYAVIFFNRGQSEVKITVSINNEIGVDYISYTLRDPVRHKDIEVFSKDLLTQSVKSHSVQVRILSLKKASSILN